MTLTKLTANQEVRNHLKQKHNMTDDETVALILLSKKEVTSRANKAKKPILSWLC